MDIARIASTFLRWFINNKIRMELSEAVDFYLKANNIQLADNEKRYLLKIIRGAIKRLNAN